MIEQIQVLENILKYLKDQKIDYILTGSLAMTFYAEPRMTRDIDIVLSIENLSPKSFTQFFQSDFYIDIDSIQMAIHYRKMFNILHNATGLKIDFIIQKENEFEKQKFKNKKIKKIKETDCFIISKEDLI
ncbi:MAG TPA: hypothetical protein PK079_21355, partial [Leptospiraceae bacterium]|nr:hypothetical protein [Leptospiraceae bacterium]